MSGVALQSLASSPATVLNPALDAHENNAHTIATAINEISAVVFTLTARSPAEARATVVDAQGEFLRIASVCLLRLGSGRPRDAPKSRDAVYVILDRLVSESPFLTADVLEARFP